MKKKSKYRPKPVLTDPVGWVIAGLRPVSEASESLSTFGIKSHGALEAVRTGKASRHDATLLINAVNMAMALAHMGQGRDWLPELKEAEKAILAAGARTKFLFTGLELQAVRLALDIHDAQMGDPATTVGMLENAINGLNKLTREGKTQRVEMREWAMAA